MQGGKVSTDTCTSHSSDWYPAATGKNLHATTQPNHVLLFLLCTTHQVVKLATCAICHTAINDRQILYIVVPCYSYGAGVAKFSTTHLLPPMVDIVQTVRELCGVRDEQKQYFSLRICFP